MDENPKNIIRKKLRKRGNSREHHNPESFKNPRGRLEMPRKILWKSSKDKTNGRGGNRRPREKKYEVGTIYTVRAQM